MKTSGLAASALDSLRRLGVDIRLLSDIGCAQESNTRPRSERQGPQTGGRPNVPTTLLERRRPSKMVVWARDGEIAILLAVFWFMARHSPEGRKRFRQA